MAPDEARQLLLTEGLGSGGIPVCVRMGDDPGCERLDRVVAAIAVVATATRASPCIDRELMMALWGIAYHGETQAAHWQRTHRWRDGEFDAQIAEIGLLVEDFIAGAFDFASRDYDP